MSPFEAFVIATIVGLAELVAIGLFLSVGGIWFLLFSGMMP